MVAEGESKMFPCPSPKGSNHAGLYLNRAGDLVDRNGALWGRRGTLAMDSLPESIRAPHAPASDAERDDEDDGERGVEALRRWLRAHTGLAESAISEACDLAASELEPSGEDDIPASGLKSAGGMGGRLSNARSRLGEGSRPPLGTLSSEKRSSPLAESEFRSSPASDSASFFETFPDVQRIGFSYGSGQFDEERHDRRNARQRQLAADATSDEAGESLARMFGPDGPARVGVGPWPKRR
jgi:hypothetical protein